MPSAPAAGGVSVDPRDVVANFGGVRTRSAGDPERARVEIVCAPYEGTVSYGRGAAAGPAAILDASLQVETRDDETGVRLEDLAYALGPVVEAAEGDAPEDYAERLRGVCRESAGAGRIPLVLGGEHSVTIGALRGVRDVHEIVHVLSIDAHPDLRDSYEGSTHSHACVGRRALEDGPLTIVGARSWSEEEARLLATHPPGLDLRPAREVVGGGLDPIELAESLGDPVYLTFDVDGLDPSVVPATGTPEPGGLGWWEALDLVRTVLERRRVVGLDVVELAPQAGSHVSDFAVARLVAKLLSYLTLGPSASGGTP
jgi:agmatinase